MSLDKKILLADDDSDFLEATQLMLMDEGFNVIPAIDGEEAVEKYKQNKPDIVFLDIKMPGIDGFEAFFRIIKFDSDARVVFTSSYAIEDEKFKKAKQLKLCGMMPKPFDFEDVEKNIKKFAK